MPHEQIKPPKAAEQDFDNLQTTMRILESGTDAELEQLRLHLERKGGKQMPQERMRFYRALAQQRKRFIDEGEREVENRRRTDPKATDIEYQLGAYKEHIERPVRAAVLLLRQKGYASFESGFKGLERQNMAFEAPVPELLEFTPSPVLLERFHNLGAEVSVQDKSVGFAITRPLSDGDLTELWNALAEELPTLQNPQPLAQVQTAVLFRKKQDRDFREKK